MSIGGAAHPSGSTFLGDTTPNVDPAEVADPPIDVRACCAGGALDLRLASRRRRSPELPAAAMYHELLDA